MCQGGGHGGQQDVTMAPAQSGDRRVSESGLWQKPEICGTAISLAALCQHYLSPVNRLPWPKLVSSLPQTVLGPPIPEAVCWTGGRQLLRAVSQKSLSRESAVLGFGLPLVLADPSPVWPQFPPP